MSFAFMHPQVENAISFKNVAADKTQCKTRARADKVAKTDVLNVQCKKYKKKEMLNASHAQIEVYV